MLLPYSLEVYLSVMTAYNAAVFPLPLLASLILGLTLLPRRLQPIAFFRSAAFITALIAGCWASVSWFYFWRTMSDFDFLSPVYALAWGLQAILLITLLKDRRIEPSKQPSLGQIRIGLITVLFGLVVYPLAFAMVTGAWQATPLLASMPDPTAIVTVGILLMVRRRALVFLVIPITWGFISAYSGFLLDHSLGYLVVGSMTLATGTAYALAIRDRSAKSGSEPGPQEG